MPGLRCLMLRLGALLLLAGMPGCDASIAPPLERASDTLRAAPTIVLSAAESADAAESIRVASFNIQVFGTSKLGKPDAMDVIVRTIRRFDVVAIQEVRSTDQQVVARLVEQVNADGSSYDYVLGPRLGRTSSKEQYAFVYDTRRLELDRGWVYTVADPEDLLHREPLVATFRVRGPPGPQPFSFKLVNIHTDPDETSTELDALAGVFQAVQQDGSGEDDVILLGDLNTDPYRFGALGRLPNITAAIVGQATNTRGTKTYDNLVFDRTATTEFTGAAGVFDFALEFGLSLEQALVVSDHFPVWAEFSAVESGAAASVATRPGAAAR